MNTKDNHHKLESFRRRKELRHRARATETAEEREVRLTRCRTEIGSVGGVKVAGLNLC